MDIMHKTEKLITGIRVDNTGKIDQDDVRHFIIGILAHVEVCGSANVVVENFPGETHRLVITASREDE